jgi:hypothetical protein
VAREPDGSVILGESMSMAFLALLEAGSAESSARPGDIARPQASCTRFF